MILYIGARYENVEDDLIPMSLLRCGRSLKGSICLDVKSGQYTTQNPITQVYHDICMYMFSDEVLV